MRAQGPNAQCKDYHDLSSALQLMSYLLDTMQPSIRVTLTKWSHWIQSEDFNPDLWVCSRPLCHLSYHHLTKYLKLARFKQPLAPLWSYKWITPKENVALLAENLKISVSVQFKKFIYALITKYMEYSLLIRDQQDYDYDSWRAMQVIVNKILQE